jgi:hypothetical protein
MAGEHKHNMTLCGGVGNGEQNEGYFAASLSVGPTRFV